MSNLFFIICFVCGAARLAESSSNNLVYTAVIFRHGDRTPLDIYPTNPNKEDAWPMGLGQLTNGGKQRMYETGFWLKSRYKEQLGDLYNMKTIVTTSSDTDRTIMSAQLILAAMYPPNGQQVWNSSINWQPIPVHTLPVDTDNMIGCTKFCHRYHKELKAAAKLPGIQKYFRRYHKLFQVISDYTGYNLTGTTMDDFDKLLSVYYQTFIETSHNKTVPRWTKDLMPELEEAAAYALWFVSYTPVLQRFRAGPILKDITDKMLQVENQGPSSSLQNVTLYSGHDYIVASVLTALGAFQPHLVPFGALLLFELHRNPKNQYIIEVYYKNTSVPQKLSLKSCPSPCHLDTFVKSINYVLPEDWEDECIYVGPEEESIPFWAVLIFVLAFLAIMVGLTKCCLSRAKRKQDNYEVY